MNAPERKVIRVAPVTAVIFSILFLPALFMGLLCIFKTGQPWSGLFLCGLYALALCAICSPTVTLTQTMLHYRTLLSSRRINLSSVTKVVVSARPAPTLELHTAGAMRPFCFIIKPFTKTAVSCIVQHIRQSSPSAHFDKISNDLLQMDFSSVTRETISTRNLIRVALTVAGASIAAALARALLH